MFSLRLTLFSLAGIVCVIEAFDYKDVVKITPSDNTGYFELVVIQKGPVTRVSFQNDNTEILYREGFDVEKLMGSSECLLRKLDQNQDPKATCFEKKQLTVDLISRDVAEFCGNRTLYKVHVVPCIRGIANRMKRSSYFACRDCGDTRCCSITLATMSGLWTQ